MNWDQIKGNWTQLKGKAQKEWGKLTDDDLKIIQGEQTQLIGRIQERYGYTAKRLRRPWRIGMLATNSQRAIRYGILR